MENPTLLLICGSLRRDSFNRKLATQAAVLFDGTTVWANTELPLYNGDVEDTNGIPAAVGMLADQIEQADAVVIATPEYNQSFSGVLKNALDWVSRVDGNPWADKPVAIMSAAAGRAGGARAQYALRLALNPFQPRLLTGPEVLIANPQAEFEAQALLKDGLYRDTLIQLMNRLRLETHQTDPAHKERINA